MRVLFLNFRRPMLLAALLIGPMVVMPTVILPAVALAAKVTYLKKPVEIKRQGASEWKPLREGASVNAGDTVRTGFGGLVEITLTARRVFRVGQVTVVEIPRLAVSKNKGIRARIRLIFGRFWGGLLTPLNKARGDLFQVATPTATLGVKGTQFGVDYDQKGKVAQMVVVQGELAAVPPGGEAQLTEVEGPREIPGPQEVTEDEWLLLIKQQQKLTVRQGEAPRLEPLTPKDLEDEWVRFNLERDRRLAQAPGPEQ